MSDSLRKWELRLRHKVEKELGRSIPDSIWRALKPLIDDVRHCDPEMRGEDFETLVGIAKRYFDMCEDYHRERLKQAGTPAVSSVVEVRAPRSSQDGQAEDPRENEWRLINQVLANRAARDPKVVDFWSTVGYSGEAWPVENIEHWVRKHIQKFGVGTEELQIPHSSTGHLSSVVLIPRQGVLFDLKKAAEYVSRMYGWPEYAAVYFLMTGAPPPYVPLISARWYPHEKYPCLDKVLLEVSIRASPEQVADLFRTVRATHLVRGSRRKKWSVLELVRFVEIEMVNRPWKERYNVWIDRHPNNSYCSEANMRTVYCRALDELGLRPRGSWRAKGEVGKKGRNTCEGE